MKTLDQVIDLISTPSRAALRILPVRVGADTHDLLLWDTRVLATSAFALTAEAEGSEAGGVLEARLANALWVGGLMDGDFLISDLDDLTLLDSPQYSLAGLLEGGLPIRSLDAASVDWTQAVPGSPLDIGGFSLLPSYTPTELSALPGWPFMPNATKATFIQNVATALHSYVAGRGVIEIVVDHASQRLYGMSDDWGAQSLLPIRADKRYFDQYAGRWVEVGEVGFNLTVRSVTFYPFSAEQHDHHRVEKIVRIRPSHGRYALEHYLIAGPVMTTAPYSGPNHFAGLSSVPLTTSSFNVPSNLVFAGVALNASNQLPYVSTSVAAPSLRWKAATPFRLLSCSTPYNGLAYRLPSLSPDVTPYTVGAYGAPLAIPGVAASAAYGVLTKALFLRVLQASVDGYDEPDKTQRLTEITNLDALTDPTLRCVSVQFADGIPGVADCVERLPLYRAARTGPVLVDVLSAVVDADDTFRSIRNRARKSVAPAGIAYMVTGDGEDWTALVNPTYGFGTATRTLLANRPQKYRLDLTSSHVVITTRRFVSEVASYPFLDLAPEQLGALWQDVQDAIERGTPVVPTSYALLAKLVAPGLTDSDRTTLANTMSAVAGRELLTSIAHPVYSGRWLWDCKPANFTDQMYVGVVAERSGELFSKTYGCFLPFIRGPRLRPVRRSYTADFLVNDNLDI